MVGLWPDTHTTRSQTAPNVQRARARTAHARRGLFANRRKRCSSWDIHAGDRRRTSWALRGLQTKRLASGSIPSWAAASSYSNMGGRWRASTKSRRAGTERWETQAVVSRSTTVRAPDDAPNASSAAWLLTMAQGVTIPDQ